MTSDPRPRERRLKPGRRKWVESRGDLALWIRSYKETLDLLRFTPHGREVLIWCTTLPIAEMQDAVGLPAPDGAGAAHDEAVSALLAAAVDRALAQWKIEGDLLMASAITNLAGLVWNWSHGDPTATSWSLGELARLTPFVDDRAHLAMMVLFSCLQAQLTEAARADPRLVMDARLLGIERGACRVSATLTRRPRARRRTG